GARGARCKPPRSARRRSAGSFGNGEGASEATPTAYHPRCPRRLRVCEEAGRKLFPRLRFCFDGPRRITLIAIFRLCSSNLRRKTMPVPQNKDLPCDSSAAAHARDEARSNVGTRSRRRLGGLHHTQVLRTCARSKSQSFDAQDGGPVHYGGGASLTRQN